jgi:hypothetical protein
LQHLFLHSKNAQRDFVRLFSRDPAMFDRTDKVYSYMPNNTTAHWPYRIITWPQPIHHDTCLDPWRMAARTVATRP